MHYRGKKMKIKTAFKEPPYHRNIRVAKRNDKVVLIEENRDYYDRDELPTYMIISYSKDSGHNFKGFSYKWNANRFFNKVVKKYKLKELSNFDRDSWGNNVVYDLGAKKDGNS